MSAVDDLEVEVLQEEPLQLSNTPYIPKPKPKLPTVRDAIRDALEALEDPSDCLEWANRHYALKATDDIQRRVQEILGRWQRVKEQRLKWSVLPTPIPSLSSNSITVKELHDYLSEILAIHPLVATIPVYHEECCGAVETSEIEFDEEKGILNFY